MVTIIGLGGAHISMGPASKDESMALQIVHRAIEHGINFFDNAHSYGDGRSEILMGKALKGHREKIFLMSKSDKRSAKAAQAELDLSLKRLSTDYLDLWQFHNVTSVENTEQIFFKDGAMEVALKAKESGKIRYIGVTGHRDPVAHLRAIELYDFDTVQMPLNVVDRHYLSFEKQVLGKLVEKDIGVLAMKSLAMGEIAKQKVFKVEDALRYVWSLPVSVLISGCDSPEVLDQNVASSKIFQPVSVDERVDILDRTEVHKGTGVERYKRDI
jgi:aryl-alcohol dehydrogenase-like predicted oxidoreductase